MGGGWRLGRVHLRWSAPGGRRDYEAIEKLRGAIDHVMEEVGTLRHGDHLRGGSR